MAFEWSELLAVAKRLAANGTEADQRSAINRAYYSVYGTARARLVSEGGPIPLDVPTHEYVWSEYSRSAERIHRFIARDGFLLSKLRVQADYIDDFPNVGLESVKALIVAEKTLANLASLR